jgi:hypothetical protein
MCLSFLFGLLRRLQLLLRAGLLPASKFNRRPGELPEIVNMDKNLEQNPQIVHRARGGWLAYSAPGVDIQIGVTTDSREAAVQKYQEELSAWRRNIAVGRQRWGTSASSI